MRRQRRKEKRKRRRSKRWSRTEEKEEEQHGRGRMDVIVYMKRGYRMTRELEKVEEE